MGKYFPEIAKAQEFLELKQGAMTMMDYVTRFIELARFFDDHVATNWAKVRRFENGLKLSIRARIVGLCLQDMDSMVGTALTIERDIEDARSTRDASVSSKRKDSQSSSSSGKRQRASSFARVPESRPSGLGTDESFRSCGTDGMLPLLAAWTHEEGLPLETGIQGFWDSTVPVSSRTGEDIVHSSTARYRLERPVLVSRSYTGTSHFTGRPERPEYG